MTDPTEMDYASLGEALASLSEADRAALVERTYRRVIAHDSGEVVRLRARVAESEDPENFRCSDCGATYTQMQLDADRVDAAEARVAELEATQSARVRELAELTRETGLLRHRTADLKRQSDGLMAQMETEMRRQAARADAAEAQVRELTERAESAEQVAQARDEVLGEWLAKVERAAEVEADLARVGEAVRDERRRRLRVVADLTRVRRSVEACGDRAAIVAMRSALDAAPTVDAPSEPASDLEVGADAPTQLAGDVTDDPLVRGLADHYRSLGCPVTVDATDPEDCASMAAETIRYLRRTGAVLRGAGARETNDLHDWYAAMHDEGGADV